MSALDQYRGWPFYSSVIAATSNADLSATWERFHGGLPQDGVVALTNALNARVEELVAAQNPPQQEVVQATSRQVLDRNEQESFDAQQAFEEACNRFASAHTRFKTLRAETYVRLRPDHKSAADCDNYVDADDDVAAARLESYIAEGLVKSAKSNIDRLERQFQYHRSLMVDERKWDERSGSRS